VTVVAGGKEQNTELLKLSFDFIFFTGSTFVGKIVAQAAAKNLTPVLLELGGMNPAIVDETANIPDAAKKIVWGAMAWGGQWCTSPGYAYVHESVADAFAAEAKKALVELFGNDPRSNSDYSRIINARTVDRLASLIDPAKVIAGAKSDRDAHYLDPTLLYPVTWDDKIMEDEVFGPILPILTYKSFDEAMARMAKTGRPLAGFIFSRDQKAIDRFIGQLSFGGGGVNLGERSSVRRDHAVRWYRIRRDGPLLWQVWLRCPYTRQVDADLPARRRDRTSLLALYRRKEPAACRMVRVLRRSCPGTIWAAANYDVVVISSGVGGYRIAHDWRAGKRTHRRGLPRHGVSRR